MRKILFGLLLSSTLAFGQTYPPDTDKDVAVGFGSGVLTNVCAAADVTLTTVGTSEEILATCTIPADTFPANFTGFDVIATYIGAANANSKTMNVRIDGIAGDIVLEVTGDTDSADSYEMMGTMTVGNGAGGILSGTGTTTQGTGASTTERMRVTGLTFSGDIDIVFTGLTAAGAGDVTLTSYILRMFTNVVGESGGHYNGGPVDNPFLAPAGAEALPSVSFTGDLDSGMWSNGNDVTISVDGATNAFFGGTSVSFRDTGTSNLMMTMGGSGGGLRSAGTTTVSWGANGLGTIAGTEALPSKYFVTDTDSGLWSVADTVNLTVGGVAGSTTAFNTTNTTFEFPILAANGTNALPAYSFASNTDMGIWTSAENMYFMNRAAASANGRSAMTLGEEWFYLRANESASSAKNVVISGTDVSGMQIELVVTDGGVSTTTFTETETTFSDPILGPNGTTDLPAFAFANDVDAGMWGNGSDTVTLQSEAADTGGRGWLEFGPAAFRLKGDSNFDLTDYVEITHGTVGGQVLTMGSWDTTNSDISRLEFANADPDAEFFISETGEASTTTFSTTSTTFSDPILAANGAGSAPAISFSTDTDAGLFLSSGLQMQFQDATSLATGQVRLSATLGAFRFMDSSASAWGIHTDADSVDIILEDAVDSAFTTTTTSIGQKIHMGASGTETLPAYSFSADTDTGIARATNSMLFVVGGAGGNTTTQTNVGTTFEQPVTFQGETVTALTDATATAFAQIAIPQAIGTNFAAGTVHYEIYCADATNQAQRMGHVDFACHNLAGTESCSFSTPVEHSLGDGTAVVAAASFDIVAGVDVVDLRANSDCTGVTPTTLDMYWEIDQQKYSAVTPQ